MKKLLYVIAATLCLMACEKNTESGSKNKVDYVDLGLSSGVQWKSANETNPNDKNGFYDYDEAMSQFEKNLPTKEQWEELENDCDWEWTGREVKVTGPNGKSITLPAAGSRNCEGDVLPPGYAGVYWSSTSDGSGHAWGGYFRSDEVGMCNYATCVGLSVRLVR